MGTQVVDMNDPNGMPKKVLIFVMGVVIFLSISQMVGAFEMSLPKATIHKHMKKLGIPNSLCKHEDLQEAKKASMVGQKSRPLRLISLSDMGRMVAEFPSTWGFLRGSLESLKAAQSPPTHGPPQMPTITTTSSRNVLTSPPTAPPPPLPTHHHGGPSDHIPLTPSGFGPLAPNIHIQQTFEAATYTPTQLTSHYGLRAHQKDWPPPLEPFLAWATNPFQFNRNFSPVTDSTTIDYDASINQYLGFTYNFRGGITQPPTLMVSENPMQCMSPCHSYFKVSINEVPQPLNSFSSHACRMPTQTHGISRLSSTFWHKGALNPRPSSITSSWQGAGYDQLQNKQCSIDLK